MAFGWFKSADGTIIPREVKEGLEDIEFKPDQMKKDIVDSVDKKFTEFATAQTEALKPMQEMAALLKQEREERLRKEVELKEKKAKDEEGDFSEQLMLDPEGAIKRKLDPTNRALIGLASKEARRETLGDKEYYYGDIKKKVDALIESMPLTQQTQSASIENCYKLVMYDHQKEIAEGKIKARNTSGIFENGGTGGHSGADSKDSEGVLSNEEKEMAKRFGMSEKDWSAGKKELSYV